MNLTPVEAENVIKDFFNTNVPLASYLRGLRNCNTPAERVEAIGELLSERFYVSPEMERMLVPPQSPPIDRRSWTIPVGLERRTVTEREIRSAQARSLSGSMNAEDKAIVDAVLSWFCNNAHSQR